MRALHQGPPSLHRGNNKQSDDHDDYGVGDDSDNENEEEIGIDDGEVLCEMESMGVLR